MKHLQNFYNYELYSLNESLVALSKLLFRKMANS